MWETIMKKFIRKISKKQLVISLLLIVFLSINLIAIISIPPKTSKAAPSLPKYWDQKHPFTADQAKELLNVFENKATFYELPQKEGWGLVILAEWYDGAHKPQSFMLLKYEPEDGEEVYRKDGLAIFEGTSFWIHQIKVRKRPGNKAIVGILYKYWPKKGMEVQDIYRVAEVSVKRGLTQGAIKGDVIFRRAADPNPDYKGNDVKSDWTVKLRYEGEEIDDRKLEACPGDPGCFGFTLSEIKKDWWKNIWGLDPAPFEGCLPPGQYTLTIRAEDKYQGEYGEDTYIYAGETKFELKENGDVIPMTSDPEEKVGTKNINTMTYKDGLKIVVRERKYNVFEAALQWVVEIIQKFLEKTMEIALWFVEKFVIIPSAQLSDKGIGVKDTWQAVVNICNTLFVLGLLIIVFANILRIQLDYYAIKILLPRLIIAMILINFSLLICMAILDLANILSKTIINEVPASLAEKASYAPKVGAEDSIEEITVQEAAGITGAASTVLVGAVIVGALGGYSALGFALLALVVAFIGVIAGVILALMLIVRVLMIWFLAIISPLPFLFMVLPFTRGLSSRWWNEWVRWVFMGPVTVLILTIGMSMASHMSDPSNLETGNVGWLKVFFVIVMLFAASAVPTMLGGQVMAAFRGLAGRAWGGLMGLPAISLLRQRAQAARFERAGARWGALGRAIGSEELETIGLEATASASKAYDMANRSPEELGRFLNSRNRAVRQAAREELLRRGLGDEFGITPQTERERGLAFSRAPINAVAQEGMSNEEIGRQLYNEMARGRTLDVANMRLDNLTHEGFGYAMREALNSDSEEMRNRARSIISQGLSNEATREAMISNPQIRALIKHPNIGGPAQEKIVQAALSSTNPQYFSEISGIGYNTINKIISNLGRDRDNIKQWNTDIIDNPTFGGRDRFRSQLPPGNQGLL